LTAYEIYEYLINYGFKKDDLDNIKKNNEKIYFASLKNIEDNILFLQNKELEKNEIIKLVKKNPYILTAGTQKKQMLDEIYSKIFNKEEIKEYIKKYPDMYIVNPIELKETIEYIKKLNLNIKDIINENINILSIDLDEISEYIKNRSK
jgi:hypothetical protein